MFDLKTLQQDTFLKNICSRMLTSDYSKLGHYTDIHSIDSLFEKLVSAKFERVKFLPISKLTIYKTSDIGLGFINNISVRGFQELIALGKIDKNIPINLKYKFGNIFNIVYDRDLDINVLLTDETYIIVNEQTKLIHSIKIGKPCNPNLLYYMSKLNKVVTIINKLVNIPNMNSIWIETKKNDSLY